MNGFKLLVECHISDENYRMLLKFEAIYGNSWITSAERNKKLANKYLPVHGEQNLSRWTRNILIIKGYFRYLGSIVALLRGNMHQWIFRRFVYYVLHFWWFNVLFNIILSFLSLTCGQGNSNKKDNKNTN